MLVYPADKLPGADGTTSRADRPNHREIALRSPRVYQTYQERPHRRLPDRRVSPSDPRSPRFVSRVDIARATGLQRPRATRRSRAGPAASGSASGEPGPRLHVGVLPRGSLRDLLEREQVRLDAFGHRVAAEADQPVRDPIARHEHRIVDDACSAGAGLESPAPLADEGAAGDTEAEGRQGACLEALERGRRRAGGPAWRAPGASRRPPARPDQPGPSRSSGNSAAALAGSTSVDQTIRGGALTKTRRST